MGLDNGIRLITKQKLDLDDWQIKPEYCKIEFDEFDTNEYKVRVSNFCNKMWLKETGKSCEKIVEIINKISKENNKDFI